MKSDWSELTMTLLLSDFEEHVIKVPYEEQYGDLKILSGYASATYLQKIVDTYPKINIELIIGMAKKDGIPKKDHALFKQIATTHPNIHIYYQTSSIPTHRKIYAWVSDDIVQAGFVGSANFSFGGFEKHNEQLVTYNYDDLLHSFDNILYKSCLDKDIEDFIRFVDVSPSPLASLVAEQVATMTFKQDFTQHPHVTLSLLQRDGKNIHRTAGLNWGQRKGRNQNQAYLPVSKNIHNNDPTFFPDKAVHFTLRTDDGMLFNCVMAQDNRKAIQTSDDNSLLGSYFRKRLGVKSGVFITADDLQAYGRTDVTIYKVDDLTFIMDFSH